MAWTQADYDKLKAAVASGVKRVTFGDRTTEFQDLNAMKSLLKEMETEIRDSLQSQPTPRLFTVQHNSGFTR